MKHIKTFEKYTTYKIGTYVNAINLFFMPDKYKKFLQNNVGQIVGTETIPGGQIKKTPTKLYQTFYNNIPEDIIQHFDNGCYSLKSDQISIATEEEIENQKIKDSANKYNL